MDTLIESNLSDWFQARCVIRVEFASMGAAQNKVIFDGRNRAGLCRQAVFNPTGSSLDRLCKVVHRLWLGSGARLDLIESGWVAFVWD